MHPDRRSAGNYRIYGESAVDCLQFVRSAQLAGFTLSDIKTLVAFRNESPIPCARVQELVSARLSKVQGERMHLVEIERLLQGWLSVCRSSGKRGRCGALEALSAPARGPRRKSRKSP
ncbi:MAG: MerR family transcriptional regulator [Phycisphaerales bacterium]|nr:MerR family transcriptional regulator [Phycisphaerales bacterium]